MPEQLITKYRPKTFEEVVGNTQMVKSLAQIVRSGSPPRGFIFSGISGIGKTTLARIVAKELGVYFQPLNTGKLSVREIHKRAIDYAGFRSVISDGTLYNIEEAHNLGGRGCDAFNEFLEEPPKSAFVSFCTTDSSKITSALETRCYMVALQPVELNVLRAFTADIAVREGMSVHDDVLELIPQASHGSVRMVLNLLQQVGGAQSLEEAMRIIPAEHLKGVVVPRRHPVVHAPDHRLKAITMERYLHPRKEK